ncbi:MAG: tyrosine-type recombinase/integrase, partial [Pseudomonadota bacterium]|nr:tyrosine-type recombinase/integrase [Pseudomonadota bacterium]
RKRIKIGLYGSDLTVAQARDKAMIMAGQVRDGIDVQLEKQERKAEAKAIRENSLEAFIDNKYKPWALANLKSGQETLNNIEYSFKHLKPLPLIDINLGMMEKWRTEQLELGKLKPNTINRRVNSLRGILTKAVEWGVIDVHPLQRLKNLKEDNNQKARFLSEDESSRLTAALRGRDSELKAARQRANAHRAKRGYELLPSLDDFEFGDRLTPLVTLSLKTGARRGELFDLTWEDVDLRTKNITIRAENSKSGKTRHIPLNQTAIDTIKAWKKQAPGKSGRVFPSDDGGRLDNVNKAWRNLLKAAEISDFRWHDMRHDFASKLVMNGVPLNTVRELCGHADLNTTLRYAHLAPDHKADAVALIG